MAGGTIAFIFLNDQIKTYILVGIIFLSVILITLEVWFLYNGGYEISSAKVYPTLENI
jgi:hypothetical protein